MTAWTCVVFFASSSAFAFGLSDGGAMDHDSDDSLCQLGPSHHRSLSINLRIFIPWVTQSPGLLSPGQCLHSLGSQMD